MTRTVLDSDTIRAAFTKKDQDDADLETALGGKADVGTSHTKTEADGRYVNETDHTKAAHDALALDAATLGGQALAAFLMDSEHTKALHDALGVDAATLGGNAPSAFLLASQRGASEGVAELVGGMLPTARLPALAINDTYTVASQTAMLALSGADRGDMAIRTDFAPSKAFVLAADDETLLANWIEITAQGAVVSVNGQSGVVVLSAADVGAVATGDFTWANLAGKPATFPPSAHGHSGEEITSGTVSVARIGTGTKDATTFYRGDGAFAAPPAGGGSSSPETVTFHAPPGAQVWTNIPAAATEFRGLSLHRAQADLAGMGQFRIYANLVAVGNATAELRLQYSTDGATWLDAASSASGVNISAGGLRTSAWLALAAGAKGDVQLRIVGVNGDGVADPSFGTVAAEFKA